MHCVWIKSRHLEPEFSLYSGTEIQGLFKDFSTTNSQQTFTAWTVLQQYLISISVIMGQF